MTQTTHQNALPLDSMLMEYRLVSVLGAGGFGITYLARDVNLDKDVAIKEYLPSAFATRAGNTVVPTSGSAEHDYKWGLDRFIQEARTLARFSHPHIVRVNRFFESNGTGYMVMDYEAGVPLKAWLQKHTPEPGIYLTGDFGVRSEVNMYLGPDGPRVTPASRQMELITAG